MTIRALSKIALLKKVELLSFFASSLLEKAVLEFLSKIAELLSLCLEDSWAPIVRAGGMN
jgi:hypothetical protein